MMYIFWELVEMSPYLLIGHWYQKKSASDAGNKAFIVNRVGDVGFFIHIMIVFTELDTMLFTGIFSGIANGQLSGFLLTTRWYPDFLWSGRKVRATLSMFGYLMPWKARLQ